jgi:hypothetical protein
MGSLLFVPPPGFQLFTMDSKIAPAPEGGSPFGEGTSRDVVAYPPGKPVAARLKPKRKPPYVPPVIFTAVRIEPTQRLAGMRRYFSVESLIADVHGLIAPGQTAVVLSSAEPVTVDALANVVSGLSPSSKLTIYLGDLASLAK